MFSRAAVHVLAILALALSSNANQIRGADYRNLGRGGLSGGGSEFVPQTDATKVINYGGEPNCDELRAMWRFSRRQSRAAEITNEIPTYRDPFAYNIWEKYPKARSVVSAPRPVSVGRVWSPRPVYGRVVQNAPSHHPRVMQAENPRVYEGVLRYLETDNPEDAHRRNFGLAGTFGQPNRMSQTGSFQRLKEMVWAERMKELHQQRLMEEEAAARSGLKDEKVGVGKAYQRPSNYVEPHNQDKSTRLKMITDHAFNDNNDNNNNNNNNGDMDMGDEGVAMYRRPYRQRSMFIAGPSSLEYW